MKFLGDNKLISKEQFGFVQERSKVGNLLHCNNEWTKALDQGDGVDVLFLDFKKAFDSVPHQRLLYKMRNLGIGNQCCQWVESFLNNRTQSVKINGKVSKEA
jgi:hypothetical protein